MRRKTVGTNDYDPPVARNELPKDFKQVLANRLPDYGTSERVWSSENPNPNPSYYHKHNARFPDLDLTEMAAKVPSGMWPDDADQLFDLMAHKFRGYAPYAFGDRIARMHPQLEPMCKHILEGRFDPNSLHTKSPFTAAIAFGRARTRIRWNKFPDRDCPLCGAPVHPNNQSGDGISRSGHPPRWCTRCGGVTHRVPTHDQAIDALQYFVKAAGFVPRTYHDLFRIPGDMSGTQSDKLCAGRMAIPFPSMLVRIGLNPWRRLLAEANVGEKLVKAARGIQSQAMDGHWTLSLLEREIDDFMTARGIEHVHEPKWPVHPKHNPNGARRADWRLRDGTMVEAAGMMAVSEYATKMNSKKALAKALGIDLLIITPSDVADLDAVFFPWLSEKARGVR